MRYNDINKVMTEKVADLISEGAIISTHTMEGTQGEIAKVDLILSDGLYRVWLDKGYDTSLYRDMIVLRVGKWRHPLNDSDYRILWMKEFDILEEYTYYRLSRRRDIQKGYYTESREEMEESTRLRDSRYENKESSRKTVILDDEKYLEIATKLLKRKEGYQRISRDSN